MKTTALARPSPEGSRLRAGVPFAGRLTFPVGRPEPSGCCGVPAANPQAGDLLHKRSALCPRWSPARTRTRACTRTAAALGSRAEPARSARGPGPGLLAAAQPPSPVGSRQEGGQAPVSHLNNFPPASASGPRAPPAPAHPPRWGEKGGGQPADSLRRKTKQNKKNGRGDQGE